MKVNIILVFPSKLFNANHGCSSSYYLGKLVNFAGILLEGLGLVLLEPMGLTCKHKTHLKWYFHLQLIKMNFLQLELENVKSETSFSVHTSFY